ncbi:YIP1 family protein [Natronorubrum sp. FCH18a]|uniref:YIP1 family protein n=1 Tax=Natronorubrum sp. FCH18a TaxID=3447018 RepID=UPI003F517814
MPSTPLVDPDEYFARADAGSLTRAVALVVVYWLGSLAVGLLWRVTGEIAVEPVTLRYLLQTLEATLLYWVVPTILLYGLGHALGADLEPADALALAAWGLVPLLAGEAVSNLFLYAASALEIDSAAVPPEPDLWLFVPLTLLACGWAAYIWRGGLRYGSGLERSTATSTALLTGGICAGLLLLPVAT